MVSAMNGSMVLVKGPVTSSLVCLKCSSKIYGRDFGVDLVCLPLSQLDFVLGMN